MKNLIKDGTLESYLGSLREANQDYLRDRPGPRSERQPVHTVYGGAQLFKADLAPKMGRAALRHMEAYAGDYLVFARAFGLPGSAALPIHGQWYRDLLEHPPSALENRPAWLAHAVYQRVVDKLAQEPVEDFRIDFEDGFGVRPVQEEHAEAARTAREVALGMRDGTLPPFIGIRIKALNDEYAGRSLSTLNRFFSTLLDGTGGTLPPDIVVTLPKITHVEQVRVASESLELIECEAGLPRYSIGLELMVETAVSIFGTDGRTPLPEWVTAARGRCTAAHFGVYDYTAGLDITAAEQTMTHPACDFARHMMQVSLAGTGVWLSDGATNIMPVAPHRGESLTDGQRAQNAGAVHRAWQLGFSDNTHSLKHAFYQGWDLHPAQLPARYAAVYAFFLDGFDAAATRLRAFVDKAAQASLVGDVFDDAATGQGLLNYFLRAINCGAITEEEARQTGLQTEEIRLRSFARILETRAKRGE
ncbi:MAG: citrate lyase beta subunit [Rhodothermales bacterium]